MTFLESLDRHLGRFAIPHLMRGIVALNALVYLLVLMNPGFERFLTLDRGAILSGEVWRLISWIFLPNTMSPLWVLFYLLFTWWLGETLEAIWGPFRLNLYYFLGVIACTAAAFIFGISGGNFLLVLSLLLALATLAPDEQVLLLVFPVKLKWVALLSLVFPWGLLFVTGSFGIKAMILLCLANYLLFFAPSFLRGMKQGGDTARRRRRFQMATEPLATLHRCETCGITEVSDPSADFRVAADGHEYCTRHLPG